VNRPTKIGKYEVIDIIGRGGMGVVYKATDPHLDRLVAIKMMTAGYGEDPDLLKRFLREAQSTASLQHANIVTVYDSGEQDGSPYLVMEYLEGENLDAIIAARRALTILEKIQFILEACRGLSYAHERGIVHRDIKPANIMFSKNGGVKLVDFGIAHIASNTLTRTGQIMGSIHYMSPEQINGRSVDARTDIFSTGVVLYQLFTYALPFEGESTAATLLKIVHDPPPPLEKFLSVYPMELESIVLRALAKNREDRYPSADEFAMDLLQVHEQLKQEMVNRHLWEAEALLAKGDLTRARDHLLQLLKLDQKHTQAIKILRLVQQRIGKEQGGEQARQLRAKAEESHSKGQFEAALHYLDQAIALDALNPELPKFREVVREAKLKAEGLQQALRRAEAAHERGDLDAARQAADEALGISADNTEAKALYRIIHRDWVERSRQRQLKSLLEVARQEISAGNLTAALNVLKQAEPLDPQGAQVHALIEEVQASREQQRRRKELERINRETEEALNRDDYETASTALEEGLRQFPQDRGLIQLKALAERQRAAAERKLFVRQQIASARQSLDAGRAAEALAGLQSALQKVPQDPQLEALLTMVKERVLREEQEQRRKELERINQEVEHAVNREDFEAASAKVGEGLLRFPQERSLIHLKELVEKQYVAAQREAFVSQQMLGARRLLDGGQAVEALALLQTALQKVPQEPQLQTLLGMVQERVARDEAEQAKSRSVQQAREALSRHAFGEAIRILEAAQVRFVQAAEIDNLLRFVREQEQKENERRTVEDAARRAQQWIAEYQYERAIQLLETTLRQAPDDQLRVILDEARQRSRDYQTGLQSAVAKARQFLREGSAAKAIEFLDAQPASYRSAEQFLEVLKAAKSLPKVQAVTRADQMATVMMNAVAPPVTSRISTPQLPPLQTQTDGISEGPRQPVKRTRSLIAAVASIVLVVGALAIWKYWPSPAPMGTLYVQTNVAAVEVYADGVLKGVTDGDKQLKIPINPGSHEIRVQKEGYDNTASQRIEIAKNAETRVPFELAALPPAAPIFKGTLTVRTNVGAVDVFVDGERKGATGNDKKLEVPDLGVGRHEVRVEKQGYSQLPAQRVDVKKDSVLPVSFTLNESQGPPSYLDIRGNPGAEVSIDGKIFGTVQPDGTLRVQTEPGGHRLELGLNGYQSWSQSVDVKRGKSLPVTAQMTLVPVAKPTATFTGSADRVQQGQSITLTWQTTNASDVTIDGIGAVQPSGSREVTPADTTTYTLTAKGPGGTASAAPVRIAVVPNPRPSIAMFAASALKIQQGESITLTWQTANATETRIDGVGTVQPNGSQQVSPHGSTTYTLTAKGPGGIVSSDPLQITVESKLKTPPPAEAEINETLERLIDAYESLSIDEVKKVYPSVPGQSLKRAFEAAKALRMRLTNRKVSESGDTATVECTETMTYTIGSTPKTAPSVQIVIQLKKTATGWIIDKM
jgi:serine/threonine protein kinase